MQQEKSIQSDSPCHKETNKAAEKKSKSSNKTKITTPSLKVLYTNADSLNNKRQELEFLLKNKDIDIALICETESKTSNLPSVPVIIDGYDTAEDKSGRGVLIIYKEYLDVSLLDNINKIFSPALFVKVSNSKSFIHLGIIYRSPNSHESIEDNITKQVNLAAKTLKFFFLYMGISITLISTG